MKLYYVPRTRSSRPRWMLEELGVPYELVRLSPPDTKKPEHLEVHPLGHVPALVDGDLRLFESAALVLYLAEKFPEKKLLPPPGTQERALTYQWLFYAMTELEPLCEAAMAAKRDGDPKKLADATADLKAAIAPLDRALAGKTYLVGEAFSAADVVVGAVLNWAKRLGGAEDAPAASAYVARVTERPAFKKATAD